MAAKHIDARAAARNTLDYPLEQDTPGANALVVYEQPAPAVPAGANPKWVEWWARPAVPAAKTARLPAVREHYPAPAPLPRTTTQPFASAPPLHPQSRPAKKAAHAHNWLWVLVFACFVLGVLSNEAFGGDNYSLRFQLFSDFLIGTLYGGASLMAVVCGLRRYLLCLMIAFGFLGFVFAMQAALS